MRASLRHAAVVLVALVSVLGIAVPAGATPPPAPTAPSGPAVEPTPSGDPATDGSVAPAAPAATEPAAAPTPTSGPPAQAPSPSPTSAAPTSPAPTTDAPAADAPAQPEVRRSPSVWMTTDATSVRYGRTMAAHGRVLAAGVPVADAPVRIVARSTHTGRWSLLGTVSTRSDGRFRLDVKPLEGARIKAEIVVSATLDAASSASRTVTVQPGLYGVQPAGSAPAVLGAEQVVVGSVYAQLAGRRVKLEALESGSWRTLVQAYVQRDGRFALRYTSGSADVRALRVVMPSGAGTVTAVSSTTSITTWAKGEQLGFSGAPCFGVRALLDSGCDARAGGLIAPTTDPERLRPQTGGAYSRECWQSDKEALVPVCTLGSSRADALRVAFIGDSHAAGYANSMRAEFTHWNWSVDAYLGVSCRWERVPLGHGCSDRYRQLSAAVLSGEYDAIVYTGVRHPFVDQPDEAAAVRDRYLAAWQPVLDAGIPLVVLGDFPYLPSGGVRCVTESAGAAPFDCAVPQSVGHRGWDPILDAAALAPEVRVVDVTRYYCADGTCPLIVGNAVVYRDQHHITGTYLATVSSKIMWELRRALR